MGKFTKENLDKWLNAYLDFLEDVVISKLPVDYKNLYDRDLNFREKIFNQLSMHVSYIEHVLKLDLQEVKEYNKKHFVVIHDDTPDKDKILDNPLLSVCYIDNGWHYLPEKYDLNGFSLNTIIKDFKGQLPELFLTEGLILDFVKIHPEYKSYWDLRKGSLEYCSPKFACIKFFVQNHTYDKYENLPFCKKLVELSKKWKKIKENKAK